MLPPRISASAERLLAALADADHATGSPVLSAGSTGPDWLRAMARPWTLTTPGDPPEVSLKRLDALRTFPQVPSIDRLRAPIDRTAVVAAHGPSLLHCLDALRAWRDRAWIIAPFRSALHLVNAGVEPDVLLLAERDARPIGKVLAQFKATPFDVRRSLRRAALVVDAFAPREIVESFERVWVFDSGLGGLARPGRLPFHGSAVLSGVSLAVHRGHRRIGVVGIGGGQDAARLSALLALFAEVRDIIPVACGISGSIPGWRQQRLAAFLVDPIVPPAARRIRGSADADAHVYPLRPGVPHRIAEAAERQFAHERRQLASLRRRVRSGLRTVAGGGPRRDGSRTPLAELMRKIRFEWAGSVLGTALRATNETSFLQRLWDLDAAHAVRSAPSSADPAWLAALILPEIDSSFVAWEEAGH